MTAELQLRYGLNPQQRPARAFVAAGELPLQVRGGQPGYINLLDALQSWQLVRELRQTFGLPAAASFKHVTPAGAALGLPLSEDLAAACRVPAEGLSALACAYARARGADRMASFGDFAALSDPVDEPTAELLAREVSDGVVAPAYTPRALERLRAKKGGGYLVLEVDPAYAPPATERREVFGITLEQPRNETAVALGEVVTQQRELPEAARRDLLVAAITLKYTPSNSVCVAWEGQAIGVGAGQQSRIHCTRLACAKAETWWLRRHPRALGLRFPAGTPRPARDNAVDAWLQGETPEVLVGRPAPLSEQERRQWLQRLDGLALASDGFIPFRDNVDRAARSGVRYIWQPGGSERDAEVVAAADEHRMVMCLSGQRLFVH
jgi:phosphoribosylaminoimidazolecarboxamide formyltransferase/IMP cyclohydrolase